jgi:hypothetical protein
MNQDGGIRVHDFPGLSDLSGLSTLPYAHCPLAPVVQESLSPFTGLAVKVDEFETPYLFQKTS